MPEKACEGGYFHVMGFPFLYEIQASLRVEVPLL